MDYREDIIRNICMAVVSCSGNYEQLKAKIAIELDKYDILPKSTEIVVRESENEQLLKLYAGSILTEGKSKKTVYAYLKILQRFDREVGKKFSEMSSFDIRLWIAKLQSKISHRTCENYRSYLSAFFTWLNNEGFIEKNPMTTIKPIRYTEKEKEAFSAIEIDALRTACTTQRERAELELMLSCGARVSEVCSMNRNDINMNTLEVLIREAKGGKQRKCYIDDVAKFHIQKYLDGRTDDDPSLFITRIGKRISKGTIESDLKKLGKKSNVENVHPHRCRRTFASKLAKKGMDARTIQLLMGHNDLNTTMVYINISDDHVANEYRRYA